MKKLYFSLVGLLVLTGGMAQDTTIIQTLTFDSAGRDYVFQFPEDTGQQYEKILMLYTMRCKDGLVSTGADRNKGCGEWDYSCNTYITDPGHTDSVKATYPSHQISNFSGSNYSFSTVPRYDYFQYVQKKVAYLDTTGQNSFMPDSGTTLLNHPFGTSAKTSKSQYLWKASELTLAGLTSGDITGIRMDVGSGAQDVNFMRIKMKHTTDSVLDPSNVETAGFTETYFVNTVLQNGRNEFKFYNNFNWNGSSNILVEISYTNKSETADVIVEGHDAGFNAALISSEDGYFDCDGSTYINLGPYSTILGSNPRTIELWSKVDLFNGAGLFQAGASGITAGDFSLRTSGTNNSWRAQLWGTPDFDVVLSGSLGAWHHYAMSYDGVTTKVYYDGVLAAQKSDGLNTAAIDFLVGIWYGTKLKGMVDDLRIWDVALSASDINTWKNRKADVSHPNFSNLIGDFGFNGDLADASSNANASGYVQGTALWNNFRGNNLFKNFTVANDRPNLSFVQGTYTTSVQNDVVTDTLEKYSDRIVAYSSDGSDVEAIDTMYGWSDAYEYLYNQNGTLIDSFSVTMDSTIVITTLNYMAKYPSRFEIMSFVTPYGIGLDFGLQGKTWLFDVSDFAPVLKGAKRFSMELGGQYQEQMDIKFLFIEGTPARKVIDIQQVWRVESRNYTQIMNDDYFEPRDIPLDSSSVSHKIRVAITGHGQEGEFIQRTHYVNVDGGSNELQWWVWKECADNPIYPQGGTWIYDRAGWCPGAPTDVQSYSFTTTNSSVNIDYGVTFGSGDSRYVVNTQLVSYGAPNFALDAAVSEVIRPSNRVEYGRINPVCFDPVVVIENTGATELTQLKITYQVSGGSAEEFIWTGNLASFEKEEVTLPISSGAFWVGDGNNLFTVSISEPNGGSDEYENNNRYNSVFDLPDFYAQNFILELVANNRYNQNNYTIKNEFGQTVKQRFYPGQAVYDDTMNLGEGCYYLEFNDSGDNGLDFWADASQSTGHLVIMDLDGSTLKVFENDFGKYMNYAFVIGEFVNVQDPNNEPVVEVYPNPSQDVFHVNMDLMSTTNVNISVVDALGKVVRNYSYADFRKDNLVIDLKGEPSGVYNILVSTENWIKSEKVLLFR